MRALKRLYKSIIISLVLFIFISIKPNINSKEKEKNLIPEITEFDIKNNFSLSKTYDNLLSYYYGLKYYNDLDNPNYLYKLFKTLIFINQFKEELIKEEIDLANNNYINNSKLEDPNDYINGQSFYDDFKIGLGDVGANGCGAIALYNLLLTLNKKMDLKDIIYDLDSNSGVIANALLGVDPTYIPVFLRNNNIEFDTCFSYKELNDMEPGKYIILCTFNGNNVSDGAHYTFINYEFEKQYIVYNMYSNSKYSYSYKSIDKELMGGKLIAAFII